MHFRKEEHAILKDFVFCILILSFFFQFIIFVVWFYNWGKGCFFQLNRALPLNSRLLPVRIVLYALR